MENVSELISQAVNKNNNDIIIKLKEKVCVYKQELENCQENDVSAKMLQHQITAYQDAIEIVEKKIQRGRDIPLIEWAHRHGLDESSVRQKARRGSFETAHKQGRDWFISELEENPDRRRKSN